MIARKEHIAIVIVMTMLITLPLAQDAQASYRPAPRYLHKAADQKIAPPRGTDKRRAWIICKTFKPRACHAAINIAYCESGLRPWARGPHDEYGNPREGMFQFGTAERKAYGYGRTAWQQSAGAYSYWKKSGFGPWQCKG